MASKGTKANAYGQYSNDPVTRGLNRVKVEGELGDGGFRKKWKDYISDEDKQNKIIKDRNKFIDDKKTYIKNTTDAWVTSHPGEELDSYTVGVISDAKNQIKGWREDIVKANKTLAEDKASEAKIKKQIADLTSTYTKPTPSDPLLDLDKNKGPYKGPTGSDSTTTTTDIKTTAETVSYTYNAPMVKSAYFTSPANTLQQLTANGLYIGQGKADDALNFWKGNNGGRGTIQMDRDAVLPEQLLYAKNVLSTPQDIDSNLYGYKFSYNPTAITMTWGAVASADPIFASSSSNPSIPIAQNLLQSYLDFNFYVNRIEDFNVIDENGYRNLFVDTKSLDGLDPAQRNRMYTDMLAASNPYPETVSLDDIQDIYNKGTMYDIEYLFKVMHGGTGFASMKNRFGVITSDVGWLPFRMLELHLGASLRYRVRVTSLTVDHLIFNARMIPVLSKVTMTCARYWDGPSTKEGTKQK